MLFAIFRNPDIVHSKNLIISLCTKIHSFSKFHDNSLLSDPDGRAPAQVVQGVDGPPTILHRVLDLKILGRSK